jgi:hypothetical protein
MTKRHYTWGALAALAGTAVGIAAFANAHVEAADHLDPPARTNPDSGGTDRAADIADVFAWHSGSGAAARLTVALTFAGPNAPAAGQALSCDPAVVYSFHIDNTGDSRPEFNVEARFGTDDLGNCFMRVSGVPGSPAPMVVPTELTVTRGDVQLFAGLRSDPFFFDLVGFRQTLMTGDLSLVNDRDFFANKNSSAIVLEFPLPVTLGAGSSLQVWATTARVGG